MEASVSHCSDFDFAVDLELCKTKYKLGNSLAWNVGPKNNNMVLKVRDSHRHLASTWTQSWHPDDKLHEPKDQLTESPTLYSVAMKSLTNAPISPPPKIKHFLTCQSSYIIYLIQCICGQQYIGRTIQKLHMRMNKHRSNINNNFLLHGVSKHCFMKHPETPNVIKVTPIDYVERSTQNRFEALRKKEMFWIYRLKTLQPNGLNEVTELINC